VTNTDATRTLPVGLASSLAGTVSGSAIAYYGMSVVGSVLATVPALFIFVLLQRHFVQGIALTGLKG